MDDFQLKSLAQRFAQISIQVIEGYGGSFNGYECLACEKWADSPEDIPHSENYTYLMAVTYLNSLPEQETPTKDNA